ncbi:serine/threonine-protein phosphatase [Streptomyces sp. NBC_01142]|uniref:PP2C family protein-serine/threonine phosphatase n=1 Tax=Streptomyces sp. NBC_01142 TaxID=2975865 RepID=UPI00224D7584|nr:PP2C family protein-serine/threonine phosphatase [Streptomyces sp. NBC_01142]MCX4821450.1 serine/threonine-protein phosphatase [Streptomyces sp. NBC_01142]
MAKVPWMLAALALVAGVLLNLFAPEPYTGLPLLAAAPLVAGATLSFRSALAVVCVTCVVSVAVDIERGRPATPLLVDLSVVGLIGVLALAVNRLIARQGRDLALARDVAEAVQRAVLPDPPREVGPLTVAAGYTAAQAEARIGGDLFAVQETPFGVRMIIGDVRGKGIAAVAAVAVAIGTFRQEAEYAPTLDTLGQRMDEALARAAAQSGPVISTEGFTTAVLAEVSADGEVLSLVNRGHPAPYLVHDGRLVRLDPTAPQLPLGVGLGDITPVGSVPVDVVRLPPGASLLLVTDGVTEARDKRGTFYDPVFSGRMRRRFRNPDELVDALTKDVGRWTEGEHEDDMAILVVTRSRPPRVA